MSNFVFSSYRDLREKLLSKSISVESVVSAYLSRIEAKAHLNAYLAVFKESALVQAKALDEKLASGKPIGKLFGMPIAIKDNIAIKGEKLTCASKILEHFTSIYNATAVERLLAEDVVILGKTNLDEFAMGSSNENSAFGAVKNPIDESCVTGGSSGGSAAVVGGDLALVALGSDTGGSVRQPASFCNVVGLKPTYGRISRYGLVAFGSSFDQIGVLAKTAEDAALTLEVMAGEDAMDSTSSNKPVEPYAHATLDAAQLRIGVPKEFFTDALDQEIKVMIEAVLERLKAQGATVIEISLPHSEYALATYYILATAEASSNLARYDGARYGYRSSNIKDLTEMYVNSRSEGFGKEVKRRIMLGTYVLSAGYYDAYYRKAQKVRRLIRDDYLKAFEQVDVILSPTSPVPPFKFGEKMQDPLTMYLADIYTVPMNLAGVPAISVPIGLNRKNLPIGLQLVGNLFAESTLIGASKLVEALR
ncbi:MAG: Asp-tRNA(Asn)/Glu-tRNA(Gln) amidotransferase subunit GatA [Chloroherpetonaceae bacterium]